MGVQRLAVAGMLLLPLGVLVWGPGDRTAPAYALTVGDEVFDVRMTGSGTNGALVFEGACEGPIGPDDLCEETIIVTNLSPSPTALIAYQLTAEAIAVTSSEASAACFGVALAPSSEGEVAPDSRIVGPLSGALDPGQSSSWHLSTAVSADDRCQGARAQIVVMLNATDAGGGAGEDSGVVVPAGQVDPDGDAIRGLAQPPRSPLEGLPNGLPLTGTGGWTGRGDDDALYWVAVCALAVGSAALLFGVPSRRRRK